MKPKKLPYPQTLEKKRFLYNVLCEALADRLFFYFHGTVRFDYDENGDGAYVECNLHLLFSTICLCLSDTSSSPCHIHASAKEGTVEISFHLPDGARVDEKQLYENASLGAMTYAGREDGFALFLPLTYEALHHLFANCEKLIARLDSLAKIFDIL